MALSTGDEKKGLPREGNVFSPSRKSIFVKNSPGWYIERNDKKRKPPSLNPRESYVNLPTKSRGLYSGSSSCVTAFKTALLKLPYEDLDEDIFLHTDSVGTLVL